jgi:hypothetical protein
VALNPLEQFRIMILQKIVFGGIDVSITNQTVVLLLVTIGFTVLFYVNYSHSGYILSR